MKWLYKFLVKVNEMVGVQKWAVLHVRSLMFRATLISNLNCYRNIPEISKCQNIRRAT